MKGPGYKQSHDVRRTWKCPACGNERKVAGDTTSMICGCREEGTFMAIVVERTVAPRPFQVVRDHDVRASEFGIDDMPVLQPHPSSLPPERTSPRRPRPGSSDPYLESPRESNSIEPSPTEPKPETQPQAPKEEAPENPVEDDWGEGIL